MSGLQGGGQAGDGWQVGDREFCYCQSELHSACHLSPLPSAQGPVPIFVMLTPQGRYLPVFASALHDANAGLVAAGKTPINLQSVLIGNGLPDLCKYTGVTTR